MGSVLRAGLSSAFALAALHSGVVADPTPPYGDPAPLSGESMPSPGKGLQRVLVLARHGNRVPNPEVSALCPNFAREVLPKFHVAPAELSRVGMAECSQMGRFLRRRYEKFLPAGPYRYDGTYAFFAERTDRNIVSTMAAVRGMFPPGAGVKGYAPDRPTFVPIATTQQGADMLMNSPRDGPCISRFERDVAAWAAEHQDSFYQKHKELFAKVSAACGADITPAGVPYHGGRISLLIAAKYINDAFVFAENEGLDYTIGGRLDRATFEEFRAVVEGMVQESWFGNPAQITYWTSDFLPELFRLAPEGAPDPGNKFHFFLNHRELMYSVGHMLGMPLNFPEHVPDTVPSGSAMIFEVYPEGWKLFLWQPSVLPWMVKAQFAEWEMPVEELFLGAGTLLPVPAAGCEAGKPCPLTQLKAAFDDYTRKTGSWVELCKPTKEDLNFAQGEASLGQPRVDATVAPTASAAALAAEA